MNRRTYRIRALSPLTLAIGFFFIIFEETVMLNTSLVVYLLHTCTWM